MHRISRGQGIIRSDTISTARDATDSEISETPVNQ